MCIICRNEYDRHIEYLDCKGCKNIKTIPNFLYNLKYLNISNTKIQKLSPYYKLLLNLNISNTKINKFG